jgi:hypothetical protein
LFSGKIGTKKSEFKEQKATIRTAHDESIENAYDNPVTDNIFFRRNPDINDESKMSDARITHKSEIIDCNKSVLDIESKIEDVDSAVKESQPRPQQSPPPQQQPSSFIYSQVYPVFIIQYQLNLKKIIFLSFQSGKKEKNSKDSTLKMVVLPYGSLSGTCATNSKNEATQEHTVEDRQI